MIRVAPRWTDTLIELLRPRRAVPIALLTAALVAAQLWFLPELAAALIALILVAVFLVTGPHGWRRLFGAGRVEAPLFARVALFVLLGLTMVALFGWALPRALGYGHALLAAPGSLLVEPALFWVGAWGLGRDIELEQRAELLRRRAEEAQLMALRANLDPHFLFNTLNALAEWCRLDPATAERGIVALARLLRGVFEAVKHPRWTLREELELTRELLELHRLRDPSAFELELRIDEGELPVPALIFLPLAENAMTHGIARGHRGRISVAVEPDASAVRVCIEGPGHLGEPRPGGHGLAATRARLMLVYGGGEVGLEQRGERVRATLAIPRRAEAA